MRRGMMMRRKMIRITSRMMRREMIRMKMRIKMKKDDNEDDEDS